MTNLKLNSQPLVAPGVANVTLAMVFSAQEITVVVNHLPPVAKGREIQKSQNIRDCTIRALDGEVHFDPPCPDVASYVERLERMVCWHPLRNVRCVAVDQLALNDLEELAFDFLEIREVRPDFSDACLSLDLYKARHLLNGDGWAPALQAIGRDVLEQMEIIHRVFHVQKIAAWAWRMIHVPFDNVFGEANVEKAGYATIASCMKYLRMVRADVRKTLAIYKSGAQKVPRTKFKFLRRYGLDALRNSDNEKTLLRAFGPERIAQLKEELRELRRKDLQVRRILREIEGKGQTPVPFVDYRMKRVDALLCPVSAVTVLAMRCANLAELLDGRDLPVSTPPAWLTQRKRQQENEAEGVHQFLNVFLFYRGVFVEDCMPERARKVFGQVVTIDKLEELAVTLRDERNCRAIIDDMKECAARRDFGCGAGDRAPVRDLGQRSHWREAA